METPQLNALLDQVAKNNQDKNLLLSLCNFVKTYLDSSVQKGYQSEVHGWEHMLWVAIKTANYIKVEGGTRNEQRLGFIAGLFHDIIRPKPKLLTPADEAPEIQSAKLAAETLTKFEFINDEIAQIVSAIHEHSFKVELKGNSTTIENKGKISNCLKAADKVRQFLPSIKKEREIFILESIDSPTSDQIINYWHRRIKKAEEFLLTPAGKIMLRHEHNILKQFNLVKKHLAELEKQFG